MSETFATLQALVPAPPDYRADWPAITGNRALGPWLARMAETPQNPEWHAEGDVLTHTRMVCDALARLPAWRALPRREQEVSFVAALLHDIGKPDATRMENGALTSPKHAPVGTAIARKLLWTEFRLAGVPEWMHFRESVCALIRQHTRPLHLVHAGDPVRRVIAAAATPAAWFSNLLLSLLAEADVRGRVSAEEAHNLEKIAFYRDMAEEAGCLSGPFPFPDDYSRYAYLTGRNIQPGQALYNDTLGEATLLCGLPGTGKDTYLRAHLTDRPVVSLDALRAQMKLRPTDPQGPVIATAREAARVHLRQHEPLVWNATNLTPLLRGKQIALFAGYGMAVRALYLETGWPELLTRNAGRADAVPEAVIDRLLTVVEPPLPTEAHSVAWVCV